MAITTNRRGFLKSSAVGASAAATMVAMPAVVRAQQVTQWRCQSMWSAAELTYKAFQDFCERIKVNTNETNSKAWTQLQLQRWTGTTWELFGDVLDGNSD